MYLEMLTLLKPVGTTSPPLAVGSSNPPMCYCTSAEQRSRAKTRGEGLWMEEKKETRQTRCVIEMKPFALFPSPVPFPGHSLPSLAFTITGCPFQAWERRLTASSRGSINSKLWVPIPYSSLFTLPLLHLWKKDHRQVLSASPKQRQRYHGKVAGTERSVGPITTALSGPQHVEGKQP